jgi:hypothetical protein
VPYVCKHDTEFRETGVRGPHWTVAPCILVCIHSFPKSGSQFKILRAGRMALTKLQGEALIMLGTTVQNLSARYLCVFARALGRHMRIMNTFTWIIHSYFHRRQSEVSLILSTKSQHSPGEWNEECAADCVSRTYCTARYIGRMVIVTCVGRCSSV